MNVLIQHGFHQKVNLLINLKIVDLNERYYTGETLITLIGSNNTFSSNIENIKYEILKLLLDNGADPNSQRANPTPAEIKVDGAEISVDTCTLLDRIIFRDPSSFAFSLESRVRSIKALLDKGATTNPLACCFALEDSAFNSIKKDLYLTQDAYWKLMNTETSLFQKDFIKFSFPPKNERKYFCISKLFNIF